MSSSHDDPLFHRLRALPRVEPDEKLAGRVRALALTTLEGHSARPLRPRQVIATAMVAGGVLAYFGWAIAFVLSP
jgi:hypothetical protein